MRIVGNGRLECGGGILIEDGNPETLLAHNLIHANRRDGVVFQSPPSLGPAVPQNLWSNTIYGNGRHGVRVSGAERPYLWNNLIVGNGADPALQPSFGLVRDLTGVVAPVAGSAMGLWHNLICGNRNGEVLPAPLEIPDTAGNQTPTGSEGAGYVASPQCAEPSTLFEGGEGRDFVWGSLDDDFFLRRTAPAVDAGTAPPTPAPDLATLEGDYYEPVSVRPADGNGDWTSEYDIGALEWGPPVKRNLPPHLSRVRRIPQISQ
jgi:hypothetical protein